MQVVIKESNDKYRMNKVLEALLYIVSYTATFLLLSEIFDTFIISKEHTILYALLAVIIIFVLDKTVKPILVFLTLPISAVTMGAFYFVLNTFILKLVDFIMFDKLDFTNIWILFIISILFSLINLIIELVIIKPIIRRVKLNG